MKRILSLLVFVTACLFMSPMTVQAKDILDPIDCSGKNSQSAVCNSKVPEDKNPISGKDSVLEKVTNIVAYAAGAAAIILVIVGSLKYITAGGDAGNAKSARDTVLYALIGLAIVVLARSLIIFVLNKLNL